MATTNPFLDVPWDDPRIFLAARRHGSFTAAARALGLGQATLSRRVAALEARLGHRLFDRSRDGLRLTPAAARLSPFAEAMEASLRAAGASLAGLEAKPAGLVRLACAPGVGADLGPPIVERLAQDAPGVTLELLADYRVRDLAAHEADLALRNVAPKTGPLVVRRLAELSVGLFASPALLARLPRRPKLGQIPLLDWSDELPTLRAQLAGIPGPRALYTNDWFSMRAAAIAGLGAFATTAVQAKLAGLVPVPLSLPAVPKVPLFLVTHEALRDVPRVAAVVRAIEALVPMLRGELRPALGKPDRPERYRRVSVNGPPSPAPSTTTTQLPASGAVNPSDSRPPAKAVSTPTSQTAAVQSRRR